MFLGKTRAKTMSPGHEGNDGGGPDVELHGAPEDCVEEGAHDCREEAGLRGQAGQPSVCYSLQDNILVIYSETLNIVINNYILLDKIFKIR
jgi:hypothetical protein